MQQITCHHICWRKSYYSVQSVMHQKFLAVICVCLLYSLSNSTKPCWNTKFTCAYKDPVCVHLINGRNGSRRWPIRLNGTVTWLLDVCNLVVSCSRLRYRLRLNRPGLLRGKREFAGRMLIILWQCAHSLVSRAYFSRMPCDLVKNRVHWENWDLITKCIAMLLHWSECSGKYITIIQSS